MWTNITAVNMFICLFLRMRELYVKLELAADHDAASPVLVIKQLIYDGIMKHK